MPATLCRLTHTSWGDNLLIDLLDSFVDLFIELLFLKYWFLQSLESLQVLALPYSWIPFDRESHNLHEKELILLFNLFLRLKGKKAAFRI